MDPKRLLVAWFRFSLNGSIGRFIRLARTLEPFGHRVDFLSLTGDTRTDWPDFPGSVLGPEDVPGATWDAVMVPGAGNPTNPLELLETLRDRRFGRRIQHVLNDPSRLERFEAVNRVLAPHSVVFNNGHWAPSDYRTLSADSFHVIPGAVDTGVFYPSPLKPLPVDPPRWGIGAFAKKNLEPVLDALDRLPPEFRLHVYGTVPGELTPRTDALAAAGRLVPHGSLFGEGLARFYRDIDVMVTTETGAGWCNPAAEAMAAGVPAVVSRAGTVDFAVDGETAVVLARIDGGTIAREITGLAEAPERLRAMAQRAAAAMRRWDWTRYAAKLLTIVDEPHHFSYYRIPELGLWGKWEPEERLAGMRSILSEAEGASVLDLGAAEGIVSHEFARRGAAVIHAFERDEGRVQIARKLLDGTDATEIVVRDADLADWSVFETDHADVLRDKYDVVLFLGLYHHLPDAGRRAGLAGALARAGRWLALRTPERFARDDDLVRFCEDRGFRLIEEQGGANPGLGWLALFQNARAEAVTAASAPGADEPVREAPA